MASQNGSTNSTPRWSFLDRPIVVTLASAIVGGIIVGGIAQTWQSRARKAELDAQHAQAILEIKYALLGKFANTWMVKGNLLGSWLAGALNLELQTRDLGCLALSDAQKARISELTESLREIKSEYRKAESVEGVLSQIEVLFGASVAKTAVDAGNQFEDYDNFVRAVSSHSAGKERADDGYLRSTRMARDERLEKLNTLRKALLTGMAQELLAAPK